MLKKQDAITYSQGTEKSFDPQYPVCSHMILNEKKYIEFNLDKEGINVL